MVSVALEVIRYDAFKHQFDLEHVFTRCEPRAVGDTEDMRIDSNRLMAECDIQNDIGRFAAHPRQRFQNFTIFRHP